ncbi:alkyldihydroxyacetonephosphate synthase-like [Topomyia yanbarensis]|uniref:alkyldihydroxyacetonephosphate synthase-like n=1 Tax=Topomyia yanbarensis TaxID=2498891 RepID=UPI00273C75E0|nr:alkyldihydroxyacetonephosphate synthase-like [Topomyia yanbarensis]
MSTSDGDQPFPRQIKSVLPKQRYNVLRWDGWGYKDTRLLRDEQGLYCSGNRYFNAGENHMGSFWNKFKTCFDLEERPVQVATEPTEFPEPLKNENFLASLIVFGVDYSEKGLDRFVRSHGQCVQDLIAVKSLSIKRIPDVVLWPNRHEQVVKIVELAMKHDVVLIPVGGNTSVSGAVRTPEIMDRTIAVIDMTQMNRLLWLSKENLTACFESGVVGQDIERELQKEGLTLGHHPDSYEFSTLGGWISTRASGVKKNTYGNIEDLVIRIKLVTAVGVLEKQYTAARVSCGPDIDHMVFGSEGTLGIVTEAIVKVRPIAEVSKFGSLVFPDYETGVRFVREIAEKRLQPASIRLMDNTQVMLGKTLTENKWYSRILTKAQDFCLEKYYRYSISEIAACAIMFEGDAKTVSSHEKEFYGIASKYGAIYGGSANSEKCFLMIFIAAYIRDFGLDHNVICDSFETSVSWDKSIQICHNVKSAVHAECKRRSKLLTNPLLSYRLTQSYDTGCCIYFYLSCKMNGSLERSLQAYMEVEDAAREEILANGGTVSHHHGIGKIRSKWFPTTSTKAGMGLLKAVKKELDPNNIFAVGNLFPD